MKTPIKIEEQNRMKYLKIDDNKGYFLKLNEDDQQEWIEIDQITKDDLMALLSSAVAGDFEMDEFLPESLDHKAHHIIYKNIHEKFNQLLESKDKFKDETDVLYKSAFDKYSNTQQDSSDLI